MGNLSIRRALISALVVCAYSRSDAASQQPAGSARSGAWQSLVDRAAWRGYQTDTIPSGWTFQAGTLGKTLPTGDIISRKQYANFEMELEWKIAEAGNAGLFYRGTEEYDHIYWTAPEYQLLDDVEAADNKTPLTRAAAAYGLYPPLAGHTKPAGEWNTTRIVVNGAHVEHWLNGARVVEYELWSNDWKAKVKASKFSAWPNYGLAKKGHIAIQGDHSGELSFRRIRIKALP